MKKGLFFIFMMLTLFSLQAQEFNEATPDPDKRHIIGLKYNLTLGQIYAHKDEYYSSDIYIPPNAMELTYTYFISGRLSVNAGFIGGGYADQEFDNIQFPSLKHSVKYIGIKPGIGLQTSRTLGRSVVHYNLAFVQTWQKMRLYFTDPYLAWSAHTEELDDQYLYIYAEIGQTHDIPLTKSGHVRFLMDYGMLLNPYFETKTFRKYPKLSSKATAVPGVGTWRALSLYLSVGMAYGFNTGK